jgi:hypothetical protein
VDKLSDHNHRRIISTDWQKGHMHQRTKYQTKLMSREAPAVPWKSRSSHSQDKCVRRAETAIKCNPSLSTAMLWQRQTRKQDSSRASQGLKSRGTPSLQALPSGQPKVRGEHQDTALPSAASTVPCWATVTHSESCSHRELCSPE